MSGAGMAFCNRHARRSPAARTYLGRSSGNPSRRARKCFITRRPAVIIEPRFGDSLRQADILKELQAWNVLGSVPAVRNDRVSVLIGDESVAFGPRVVEATRRLARALHPEAFK